MFKLYVITNITFKKLASSDLEAFMILESFYAPWNKVIPKCEEIIADGEITVPVSILADPVYPLLPFVIKKYPKEGKDDHEKFFRYKTSSARIVIENAFGRLKGRFCCLNRAMNVNVKELPNLIMSCFVLHNFCEFRNKKLPNGYLQNARVEVKILQRDCQRTKYRNVVNASSAMEVRRVFLTYFD